MFVKVKHARLLLSTI